MISIVIPAYNNPDSVRRLVGSIQKQFDPSKGEIIIFDDGSDKCGMLSLKNEFRGLKVMRSAANKGAASARNSGVKAAVYDVILFLDSDMELCDNAVSEFQKTMDDPTVDAVVGTVCDIPLNRGVFQDYWALLKSYFHSLPGRYSSTFYPMLGAIRKSVFESVGGFDSGIKGASIEDYEFSLRLLKAGYKILFNPKIMAKTSYKNFSRSVSQSVERSKKWGIMFLDRMRFDNHTTTAAQGAANILGFLVLISLLCAYFNRYILISSAVFLILLLCINRRFFKYILDRRGPVFLTMSVSIYLLSSFFITIGFLMGILYAFRSKKSRMEALYD